VVSKADSLETALSEASNLIDLKPLEQAPKFPKFPTVPFDPLVGSTPFLPPSSYLGPTLTTNFPLLVTPIHSRPTSPFQGLRIPSPLDCLRPPSPGSLEGFRPHSPASINSDQWIAPPPSMFADGLLPPSSEAGSPPCSAPPIEVSSPPPTGGGSGSMDVPCVVVSAPSPEHDAPSPLPSPDENLLFDPFFLAEYRRSSHDGSYGRRSNATRRISSGCLFGELQAPNSPATHPRMSPSPRHSIFNATPRGSLFSPRG